MALLARQSPKLAYGTSKVLTSRGPGPGRPVAVPQQNPNGELRRERYDSGKIPYRPRHAAKRSPIDSQTRITPTPSNVAHYGRRPVSGQLLSRPPGVRGLQFRGSANGLSRAAPDPRGAEKAFRERQLAGLDALLSLANPTALTQPFSAVPLVSSTQPDTGTQRAGLLAVIKDPALRGALALISSAVIAGGLGFVFWAVTAHHQSASGVGSVSAEVSAITFLASMGSLNLINVFARFLPEAGWNARRMILISYSAAVLAGLLLASIFLATPLASGLVLGGTTGRLAFASCVVLNSIFMIQDGGLVGFGRAPWVPVENILVASARLALLPLCATLLSARIGILWSWALPMAVAVLVVNAVNIGPLAGRQSSRRPQLPRFGELSHFIAIESVTTAVSAAAITFLPALVTRQLGATQGGYFYVPWTIATMASLLLSSTLISMVREAVARPETASLTIRRSLRLVLLVVIVGAGSCIFLSRVALAPLGSDFAVQGTPLLRWVGFALPAAALNLLYWATCLVRRRPWPVFGVNLTTSAVVICGVMLLGHGANISQVGIVYCLAQWCVALVIAIPTIKAMRTFGAHRTGGKRRKSR